MLFVKLSVMSSFPLAVFLFLNIESSKLRTFHLGAVYMIPDRVQSGMKDNIWYRVYMNVFPNELIPNEALLSREPAKAQKKTKEKQDYACADRDVSRSRSGMRFDLRLYDSGIGSTLE